MGKKKIVNGLEVQYVDGQDETAFTEEETFDVCVVIDGVEVCVGQVTGASEEEMVRRGQALAEFYVEEMVNAEEERDSGETENCGTLN